MQDPGCTQACTLWLPRDHSDAETGREDCLLSQNLSHLEGGTEFSADKASGGQELPGPSQRAWEPTLLGNWQYRCPNLPSVPSQKKSRPYNQPEGEPRVDSAPKHTIVN